MRHADFDEIEEYACTREQVEAARAAEAAPKPEWQDRFPRAGEGAQSTEKHKLKLGILGSGSKGNCSIIAGPAGAIMVDCGFPKRTTLTRMKRLGIDPADVAALILTHEHSDHLSGVALMARTLGIPVYTARGTADCPKVSNDIADLVTFSAGDSLTIAGIDVDTFSTSHDAADPIGMRFSFGDDTVGFMTDTGVLPGEATEKLAGSRVLAIECNHDLQMLKYGPYPSFLKARIAGDHGHLSNAQGEEATLGFLWDELEYVVGMHLSETNNVPGLAHDALQECVTREGVSTCVLTASQTLPLLIG